VSGIGKYRRKQAAGDGEGEGIKAMKAAGDENMAGEGNQ